jgi:hypothetical protein
MKLYFQVVHNVRRSCHSFHSYVTPRKLLNGLQQRLLVKHTLKVSMQIYFWCVPIHEPLLYRELKSKLIIFCKIKNKSAY